ncbi:MAG: hypothetical protein KHX55_08505 [Proteobacteria bacterium]|nr:hypothetical protein [Pseudomonadota bacterium]
MNTTETQINETEEQATLLMNYAMALSKAATSDQDGYKLLVLDENLKLWVEIETSLKSAKNLLPQDIRDNLLKLSKFVERMTLSKGVSMSKSDFDCLANINMQISEGLLAIVKNSLAKEEAYSLLKCAVDLSTARENNNSEELVTALDNNLQLWVYIKTLASAKNSNLPDETKNNLVKLAEYVSAKTLELGKNLDNINDRVLDSMINTNLQISEGLISNANATAA